MINSVNQQSHHMSVARVTRELTVTRTDILPKPSKGKNEGSSYGTGQESSSKPIYTVPL